MSKFYPCGLFYDLLIEPLVRSIKQRVSRLIYEYNLYPALDICCGTGKQCHLIGINGQKTVGLDLDLKMMNYAIAKFPHILFICADASNIPMRNASFNGIVISYALHDKKPELRTKILDEAKRLLTPDGKIILVDYEQPWNRLSRVGGFFTYIIERTAGREHFRNWQDFLNQGGLQEFIKKNGLVEIERRNIELGNTSIVITKNDRDCV